MEHLLRDRRLSFLALTAACASFPAAVIHFFGTGTYYPPTWVHFVLIAVGASIAAAAALTLTIAGARRNDGRTVLLGTAFTVMTALLAVHGFATPGVLVGETGVIAVAGAAVLPVGAALLALSALPALRRPQAVRRLLVLQAVLVGAVVGFGLIGLLAPEVFPAVPQAGSSAAIALLIAGLLFFAWPAARAVRTFVLTRRLADLLVVLGIVWLAVALVPQLMMNYGEIGWWVGHGLELIGVVLVGGAVAFDLWRSAQSRPLAGDLQAGELVAAEEAFLGPRIRALMERLAEKDAYTEGHTRRVAQLAVRVGEERGLSPGRLRSLAIGGLLHDIGKLSVPDEILQKPGPLDPDEYEVVCTHASRGAQLVVELGGFRDEVRKMVLGHHERLDGTGYPHGRHGPEIDLETRILACCDVYDALRSTRVYRDAWSEEQALDLLRTEAGHSLDADCVAALERVLQSESRAVAPALAAA
jgi:HD-GYP domain-containing protein (c-di-GMP phosphodiesterase class II)